MNDYWFYENHTEGYRVQWKIKGIIHTEKTRYQELAIIDTVEWGKALVLDGNIQVTEKDEFVYHEMISHVGMNSHPHPEKILIIGGGDGGTAREVLKHDNVKSVDMVEIDDRVVENSKTYLPAIASAFSDKRLYLHIDDGLKFVKRCENKYDMVLVDSSDPIGPAIQLFGIDFYRDVFNCLADDGMVVAQSESPVFYGDTFRAVNDNLKEIFPIVKSYLAPVATYVAGPWSFTAGSKKYDPEKIASDKSFIDGLSYYNRGVHKGAFQLPQYIGKLLR